MKGVDTRKVRVCLEGLGAELVRNSGGCRVYAVPGTTRHDGQEGDGEVRIPARDKEPTDLVSLRHMAATLGVSQKELRDLLETPTPARNGRGPAKPPPPVAGSSKSDAIEAVASLREAMAHLVARLQQGQRDPVFYKRAVHAATRAASDLRQVAATDGEIDSPSDKGYRPPRLDPLTNGPGRVQGNTAVAVRRRTAFTKWELDEREANG